MKKFKRFSLEEYLTVLASRAPVPGGGSAAAVSGALGAGLLSMVAQYSLGKATNTKSAEQKIQKTLLKSESIRKRLTQLIDEDAVAYQQVVAARKSSKAQVFKAQVKARKVPQEVCFLCYRAIELAPDLVKHGNINLVSDVQVAVELLLAAFNSARILKDS